MREIGSEFWTVDTSEQDMKFFLSGRTALEFIIRDVLEGRKISAVHLPSYCCHTMIEPFLRHGIPIRFYDVYHKNGTLASDVPNVREDDIYFHIRYFGYTEQKMADINEIKKTGCIVIEDTTHSWLLDSRMLHKDMYADYMFTSYRKWTGFTGVATAQKNARFSIRQEEKRMKDFELTRLQAQSCKRRFIEGMEVDKSLYLKQFNETDSLLRKDYVDLLPSYESIQDLICLDKNRMSCVRNENAHTIYQGLAKFPEIITMFSSVQANDAPLCVPILVPKEIRNKLREFLISKEIYCPIHWPISSMHNQISELAKKIYEEELSLICDQRYGTDEMKRIVQCIEEFFEVYIYDNK